MELTNVSSMSVPEIISLNKLQSYANNDLFVNIYSVIKSVKPAILLKEGADNEGVVPPTNDISNKNVCYLSALQHLGITQNNTEEINEFETAPYSPDTFH